MKTRLSNEEIMSYVIAFIGWCAVMFALYVVSKY